MGKGDMTRRGFLGMGLGAGLALSLGGCMSFGRGRMERNKLYIVHINDIHGYIAPSETAIGYPRIAGFIEQFKAEHPHTLVLDAGDVFQGSARVAIDDGEGALRVLNTLGLDAMTAGNADFILGPKLLRLRTKAANFPILAANIADRNGGEFLPGHAIVTLPGGLKAGIIGLTPPNTGWRSLRGAGNLRGRAEAYRHRPAPG